MERKAPHAGAPDRVVSLKTTTGPLVVDIARAAVLVVDMQNDFCAAGGMFHRAGIDISAVRDAIAPTAKVLDAARRAGMLVIYLKMGYLKDLSDLGPPGSPNRERHLNLFSVGSEVAAPDGRLSRVLIRDTWNTAVLDELKPQPGDVELYKSRYSGFFGTELDSLLRSRGMSWLIVTGVSTSVCVESTIRDAMFRDYSCIILSDCSAEPLGSDLPRTNHEASLLVIQALLGWVSDSGEILRALGASTG